MYGYVGGPKQGRKYPSVSNVREEFYERHQDACVYPEPGEIPLVQKTIFRLFISYLKSVIWKFHPFGSIYFNTIAQHKIRYQLSCLGAAPNIFINSLIAFDD